MTEDAVLVESLVTVAGEVRRDFGRGFDALVESKDLGVLALDLGNKLGEGVEEL